MVSFKTLSEITPSYTVNPPTFSYDDNKCRITLSDNGYSCGGWIGTINNPSDNCIWNIKLPVFKVEGKNSRVMAAVVQYDEKDTEICGDNFNENNDTFEISIEPSSRTKNVKLKVLFSADGNGEVEFEVPSIKYEEKRKHRVANVATAFFSRKYYESYEENIPNILRIIDNAAKHKADIICFTEVAYNRGAVTVKDGKFIPDNHPHIQMICEKAKEHKMYVIFGLCEEDKGKKYNTALIISPEGEICGKYRKTHLCFSERESGIIPGDDLPVFQLPFAKIGILICWDMWFPEAARILAEKGAEIIFIPTAGDPQPIYRARAYENGVYVAVSGISDDSPSSSCIINQYGEIIASVPDEETGFVISTIDFDEHKYLKYLSFNNGYGASLYNADKRNDLYIKEVVK